MFSSQNWDAYANPCCVLTLLSVPLVSLKIVPNPLIHSILTKNSNSPHYWKVAATRGVSDQISRFPDRRSINHMSQLFLLALLLPIMRAWSLRTSLSRQFSLQHTMRLLSDKHPMNNVPESINEKVGRNLHLVKNHPLNIIKKRFAPQYNT
jgi:hypothetical protein